MQIHTHNRGSTRRGFTLAELLVILGIILLVLAISVPAFTAFMGSRSVEAAHNVVAASIVRSRGEAIRRGVPCGVFFYVDPDTRRTGVAIVTLDPLTDPDPYDEYKSFTRSTNPPRDYQAGTFDPLNGENGTPEVNGEPAMRADRVVVLGADYHPNYSNSARYANFAGRPIILTMQHTADDVDGDPSNGIQNPGLSPVDGGDTTTLPPPNNVDGIRSDLKHEYAVGAAPPGETGTAGGVRSVTWALQPVGTLELIEGIDPELLAASAAAQVILGQTLDNDTGLDGAIDDDGEFRERYAASGLILFDNQGRLMQAPYRLNAGSRLGAVIGLTLPIYQPPVTSALGVVLYEVDAFDSAAGDGTAIEWQGNAIASAQDDAPRIEQYQTTIGDINILYPDIDRPVLANPDFTPTDNTEGLDEYAEERWLDANTIPLMVNRYSGTLVEAE